MMRKRRGLSGRRHSTRCTGDARADDHTRDVAFASRGRAGIDPGLIDTEAAYSQGADCQPAVFDVRYSDPTQ